MTREGICCKMRRMKYSVKGNFLVIRIPLASLPKKTKGRVVPLLSGHTPRQFECLNYILRGMTNRQIAGQMKITVRAVKWYVTGLLQTWRVNDRAALRERITTMLEK